MAQLQTSADSYYFRKYGDLINSSYVNYLQELGIINTGCLAEGAKISDSEGNIYIDCTSGFGIGNVGHNNPVIVNALIDQLRNMEVNTRPFINKIQIKLAELLKVISPGDLECSYLFNSGSEAIENAIKLVRLYKGKKKIITMKNSFHGYTLGALSASGVSSFKKSFEPLLPGFEQIEFGNIEELNLLNDKDIGAVLIEPIQHDAGIMIPSKEYMLELRKKCTEKNIILIFDEVITGIGKTGHMFAAEYFQVVPDILVIGKSLGAGLIPVGALVARKDLWQRFGLSFSMSASSYSGNALACRAAIETVSFIRSSDIMNSVKRKEIIFTDNFNKIRIKYPDIVRSIHGIGMMFGMEIINYKIATAIVKDLIKSGVLVYQSFGNPNIIMIEPSLVVTDEQVDVIIKKFDMVFSNFHI
jgi:putrescine aminotransferase